MSDVKNWIKENTIFEYIAGSHSYGLNTPESDIDYRGVCIPPKKYWFGIQNFEQYEGAKDKDFVIYGIKKFFQLATDCNPNIIEFLYCSVNSLMKTTDEWENIRSKRDLFLSKKAKFTFSGYAISQLNRIKRHRKWLQSPIEKKPERKDYGLSERKMISSTNLGAFKSLENDDYTFDKGLITIFTKENQYQADMKEWSSYQNWLKNRNLKRMKLEKDFGYDTKHAMHLVRLLKMGIEILSEGEVYVYRNDKDFLLEIRNGEWSYNKLIGWVEDKENELDSLYETSELQKQPKRKQIDKLLIEIVEEYFK